MEKILDESLFTSEVCVQCGHCCKWTTEMQHVHPEKGPEWLNVIAKHDRTQLLWYDNQMVEHKSLSEGRTVTEERAAFKIRFTCPKLEIDEEAGTKMCGIYEDRPRICRDYNCFRTANNNGQRPENWKLIQSLVEKVHGIKPEWTKPLIPNKITVKEIF